jgi:hypothetical protein
MNHPDATEDAMPAPTPEQLAEWRRLALLQDRTSAEARLSQAVLALLDALEKAEVRANAGKQIGRFIKAAADAYEKLRAVEAKSDERRRLLEEHEFDKDGYCPECRTWHKSGHAPDCAWAKAMQQ